MLSYLARLVSPAAAEGHSFTQHSHKPYSLKLSSMLLEERDLVQPLFSSTVNSTENAAFLQAFSLIYSSKDCCLAFNSMES